MRTIAIFAIMLTSAANLSEQTPTMQLVEGGTSCKPVSNSCTYTIDRNLEFVIGAVGMELVSVGMIKADWETGDYAATVDIVSGCVRVQPTYRVLRRLGHNMEEFLALGEGWVSTRNGAVYPGRAACMKSTRKPVR
jgi:hypothetical protein